MKRFNLDAQEFGQWYKEQVDIDTLDAHELHMMVWTQDENCVIFWTKTSEFGTPVEPKLGYMTGIFSDGNKSIGTVRTGLDNLSNYVNLDLDKATVIKAPTGFQPQFLTPLMNDISIVKLIYVGTCADDNAKYDLRYEFQGQICYQNNSSADNMIAMTDIKDNFKSIAKQFQESET